MTALVADGQAELAVELGIGRQGQAGVWDTGTWDSSVWAQSDTTLGDWVDVTCSVVDGTVTLAAGSGTADGVVTRWEAASASFVLIGADWSPWEGRYAGVVGPNMPVRVRWRPVTPLAADLSQQVLGSVDALAVPAGWYLAFTGNTTDDGYTWSPAHEDKPWLSTAAVQATDDTSWLASFDGTEQPEQGAGETATARVTRILDMALWPAASRDMDTGGVAVKATTLAEAAWTMLLNAADTDLALLWVRRDGRLGWRSQGRVKPPLTVAATLVTCLPATPDPKAIQVTDLTGGQPRIVRNWVSVSRQAKDSTDTPATYTRSDSGSISRYRPHRYSRTDLINTDDSWSDTVAQAILASGAWPSAAPQSVHLSSRLRDPDALALLLTVEPHMAVTVQDSATWRCAPIGWEVSVARREVRGRIDLLDIGGWVGGQWDSGQWDIESWGV